MEPHRGVRDGIGGVEDPGRDQPVPLIRAPSASAGLDREKNRGVRTVQRQPVAGAQGSDKGPPILSRTPDEVTRVPERFDSALGHSFVIRH